MEKNSEEIPSFFLTAVISQNPVNMEIKGTVMKNAYKTVVNKYRLR